MWLRERDFLRYLGRPDSTMTSYRYSSQILFWAQRNCLEATSSCSWGRRGGRGREKTQSPLYLAMNHLEPYFSVLKRPGPSSMCLQQISIFPHLQRSGSISQGMEQRPLMIIQGSLGGSHTWHKCVTMSSIARALFTLLTLSGLFVWRQKPTFDSSIIHSILTVDESRIWEFTNSLKFICNPQIKNAKFFHNQLQTLTRQGKIWVTQVHIPAEAKQSSTGPYCFSSPTINRCPFMVILLSCCLHFCVCIGNFTI